MTTKPSAITRWRRLGRRGTTLLLCAAGTVAVASTAVGGSLAAAAQPSARPAVTPTKDIVGTGQITCKVATGEVGYSPSSKAAAAGKLRISIVFQATGCGPLSTATSPVPQTVTGAMSFTRKNGCPLFSPPILGKGMLTLSYNVFPVPTAMIDPSSGVVTVTQSGPYWILKGTLIGSYPSTSFVAVVKPDPIAPGNCKSGITSEYISRAQTPFISHI